MTDWSNLTPIRAGIRTEYLHESGIRLVFDFVNPTSRGIDAWCEVRWQGNVPDPKLLTFGRYDLMGARTVTGLANQAASDCPKISNDTPGALREMIRTAIYDMINTHLEGPETVVLADVDTTKGQWLLYPLLESTTATRIIAPGGSTKSFFALAIAITMATGRPKLLGFKPKQPGTPLYLDWEADPETHALRLKALCAGAGIDVPRNIIYSRQTTSLAQGIHGIAATVAKHNPSCIIIDSNTAARGLNGGPIEEATKQLFGALASLGRPSIVLDHKSADKMKRGERGGYGSVFNQNFVRVEWEYVRINQTDNTTAFAMSLEKANNTRKGIELAYEMTFHTEGEQEDEHLTSVQMRQINPMTVTAATFGQPQIESMIDRICALLATADEPLTTTTIADVLGATPSTIRTTLNRNTALATNVGHGGEGKWVLRSRADAALPDPF